MYKAYLCSKIHNKICFVSFLLHFFFVHLPFKFIIKFVKFVNDKFIYLLYKYGHKMYKIMNTNHNSRHRFIARETDRKLEDPTCDSEHGFQGRLHSDYNFRSNVRQTCASQYLHRDNELERVFNLCKHEGKLVLSQICPFKFFWDKFCHYF